MIPERGHPVVLFDGVCGFCQASVQALLQRDPQHVLRFAPLQSDFAQKTLSAHGYDATKLDTVYVVAHDSASDGIVVRRKTDAIVFLLRTLGYRVTAALLAVVPRFLRNLGYDAFASLRYTLFGKKEACYVPSKEQRAQFVE